MTKLGVLLSVVGLGLFVYFGLVFRPKALNAPSRTAFGKVRLPNSSFPDEVADRVVGILVGLVVGKPIGILLAVFLLTRVPSVRRTFELRWGDMLGVGLLAGIGFTVALLVGELSYGVGSLEDDHAKIGILSGSVIAAIVGGAVLAGRARRVRQTESASPSPGAS